METKIKDRFMYYLFWNFNIKFKKDLKIVQKQINIKRLKIVKPKGLQLYEQQETLNIHYRFLMKSNEHFIIISEKVKKLWLF